MSAARKNLAIQDGDPICNIFVIVDRERSSQLVIRARAWGHFQSIVLLEFKILRNSMQFYFRIPSEQWRLPNEHITPERPLLHELRSLEHADRLSNKVTLHQAKKEE
jgi:hypothetical protein